jgi:RNA polymerase sigma-70 factor (ECF subfamily)
MPRHASQESPDVVTSEPALSQYLHDPDVQLMLRAKRGDDAAFSQLVENYQDRLVAVLYHLLGNQEAAEDLGQEVFLRIYRNRSKYEAKAKFSTWLFHIANNLASNWRRDGARRREAPLVGSDSGPLGARPQEQLLAEKSALMPARVLDRNETQTLVRAALESLNDRQKMAVLLHKFEQMSYIDIAAAMDLTPQAVKSLLSRARENLRVYLEPFF